MVPGFEVSQVWATKRSRAYEYVFVLLLKNLSPSESVSAPWIFIPGRMARRSIRIYNFRNVTPTESGALQKGF